MACYEIAVQVDTMSRERWEQIRKQINYVEYVAIPQQDINVLIAGPSTENRWVHKQAVEEGLLPQAVSRSELYMHMHAVVWMRLFEFTPALKKIKSDKGLVYINAWMCVNQTGTFLLRDDQPVMILCPLRVSVVTAYSKSNAERMPFPCYKTEWQKFELHLTTSRFILSAFRGYTAIEPFTLPMLSPRDHYGLYKHNQCSL